MTRRPQQVILHLLGCTVFLALPFLFSPDSLNLHSYLTNPPTQRDVIAYILLLGVFYGNYYLLIPRLYFRRRYVLFITINLLWLACILFLPVLFIQRHNMSEPFGFVHMAQGGRVFSPNGPLPDTFYGPPPGGLPSGPPPNYSAPPPNYSAPPPNYSAPGAPAGSSPVYRPPSSFHFIVHHGPPIRFILDEHFFLFLVILFLALLLKIRDRWIRAEEEKLHAELAYLKTQINPHFLFNTLNSIYAMALGRSEQTAGAIVQLSSMMRYVLVEAGKEKVPLEKELGYLTDYIQLQQTRFEGSLRVILEINGLPEEKQIFPLLLIPFVENAFKYGVNPEAPSTIGIRLDIGDHGLQLRVTNHKVAVVPADTPGGLGISNTRRRLQLLYPGRHSLIIEDEPKTFTVLLNLLGI
ncbi:MAG TPA: histidine kinase [Puia sp.]|nr:histidine kinase [Puia sp.]